jgi:hypothetical protein
MEIARRGKAIKISQSTYIKNIAEKFGVINNKPVSTPMDPGYKCSEKDTQDIANQACNRPDYDKFITEYRSIIGSCMYAQMLTRPDIAYPVSVLSKHLNRPTYSHMKQARRMLTYLYFTHDKGIIYGQGNDDRVEGWSDSDHAGDIDNRKSQTGWIFKLYGGAISWRSYQQSCVALSSPEAEYMALSDAGKEARSLLKMARELLDKSTKTIIINEDNRAAALWTRQNSHQSKTKQIEISFHHIRDEVAKNRIKIEPVCSTKNLADALTKPLPRPAFVKLNSAIFGEVAHL